jgi:hypothetical protein
VARSYLHSNGGSARPHKYCRLMMALQVGGAVVIVKKEKHELPLGDKTAGNRIRFSSC